jgi:hypothetical protein
MGTDSLATARADGDDAVVATNVERDDFHQDTEHGGFKHRTFACRPACGVQTLAAPLASRGEESHQTLRAPFEASSILALAAARCASIRSRSDFALASSATSGSRAGEGESFRDCSSPGGLTRRLMKCSFGSRGKRELPG